MPIHVTAQIKRSCLTIFRIEQLKEVIDRWEVEKKTKEHFLVSFKNYEVEQEDEFRSYFGDYEQKYLDYYIKKITIVFNNFPEFDYNHLVSHLWIEYKRKIMGEYNLLFSFDGEIYDSNLVMY